MRRVALAVALLAALVAAAPAAAHIDVLPAQLPQGASAQIIVRVPTEREVATTRVRVEIPAQVTVYAFGPVPPGWTVTPIRGQDGKFRTVVWSGGRIPVNGYVDFTMLGTPFESGQAVWKAYQTYADGKVKPWTGTPETPGQESPETGPTEAGPAAAQTILEPGTAATDTASVTPSGGGDDDSSTGVWLGVIAIGISLLAVLATGLLWSTRPAKLPPDDEEPGA